MKKIICFALLLALALGLSSCDFFEFPDETSGPDTTAAQETSYDIVGDSESESTAVETEAVNDVKWDFNDETGVLTISGTGAMDDYGTDAPAPWYEYRNTVKSVVIEDGVTRIGSWAFNSCLGLTEVSVPDSVIEIGDSAFLTCRALKSFSKGGVLNYLGASAFEGCSAVTSIKLPGGFTEIGGTTFAFCVALTDFVIPDGVTKIGNGAFNGCTELASITIPAGVTFVGDGAFFNCNAMSAVTFKGNAEQWAAITFGLLTEKVKDASVTFG